MPPIIDRVPCGGMGDRSSACAPMMSSKCAIVMKYKMQVINMAAEAQALSTVSLEKEIIANNKTSPNLLLATQLLMKSNARWFDSSDPSH